VFCSYLGGRAEITRSTIINILKAARSFHILNGELISMCKEGAVVLLNIEVRAGLSFRKGARLEPASDL
jgi:hypothetical protein